jgi:hypothetical protein
MTRGELEKLEELFKIAYTNKVYSESEAKMIEDGIDYLSEVNVTTGAGVYTLNFDLLDKELLKELVMRYIECLRKKKEEAVKAFKDLKVEFPEGFVDKFGKPSSIPNNF